MYCKDKNDISFNYSINGYKSGLINGKYIVKIKMQKRPQHCHNMQKEDIDQFCIVKLQRYHLIFDPYIANVYKLERSNDKIFYDIQIL